MFGAAYVGHETPGYFWDYAGYHDQYRQLTEELRRGDWPNFLATITSSLQTSDYNVSPVLPLLPISLLVGDSRLAYILSLILLYLIPASIILVLLIQECWKGSGRGISFWLALGCVLLYPMFWAPTLRGYPDIAALIPMGLAGLLILRTNSMLQASVRQSLWIGLLLWCTFLLRRHFAYSIVAIILVTLSFAGWQVVFADGIRNTLLGRFLRNTLLAGVALLLPALIVQGPLLQKILTTSYGFIYSAYQAETGEKLVTMYERNGPIWTLLAGCGALYATRIRNTKALFCLCVGLLSYAFFQHTQAPGIHHTLPFVFWLAPLAAWPLTLINAQATGRRRAGLGALLLGLLSAVSLPVLAWTDIQRSPLLSWSKPLQARATFPPFRIESYPVLIDLVKELSVPEYTDKQILILASSVELNPSIIASLSPEIAPRVDGAGDVDLRDGFALKKALSADYIITTWEPSLHLPAKHQQVVVIPVRALFDPKNPLAKSYERKSHRSFRLSDGNTVYIFKRTSLPSQEASSWLTAEFRKHYPSWERKDGKIGPHQP
ncbi:hypothetical protein [Synechococcus sp. 1G10]|uniref:hypothetical protein n=1 Tax=Synechococcus sp. 1G10 TaxID=2025605 RepID=UPI000B99122D|nr:hypothetical protein [Synechococcus sp. 1G10]